MITSIEKQYGGILGLSICLPRRVLSTETSNSEQMLLNKQFGAEQKSSTAQQEKNQLLLLFFIFGFCTAQRTPWRGGEGRTTR